MSAKYDREVTSLAKRRGWNFVRTGAHNQLILEHPPTGARATILCTPRTRPPVRDLVKKLAMMERSSAIKTQSEVLSWICDRYGLTDPAGSVEIHDSLVTIVSEFLGRKPTQNEESRIRRAITSSDRVWMMGQSTRGTTNNPTPRLILGPRAALSGEQMAAVQQWPQVNGVLPGQLSVEENRQQMVKFVIDRGWIERKSGTFTHLATNQHSLRIREAFAAAQNMAVVTNGKHEEPELAATATVAEPWVDPNAPEEAQTWAEEHGVVPVQGEEPVPSIAEQNVKAAETIGLPVELVTALRDYLKIDNKNVLTGMDMVREALGAAAKAHSNLGIALEDLGTAIDLIKVEG